MRKRRRKWLPEYRCDKLGTNIIKKISYCGESYETCDNCPYNKGKQDEEPKSDHEKRH